MPEEFWDVAKIMAVQVPEMAIAFLGIVLSFANWSKHPRPALLSFLGFAVVLGANIAFGGFLVWQLIAVPNWDGEILFLGAFGARSLLNAGSYLLLICAIYASRKPKAPLHSALSHGLRNASDEDCLAAAKDIRGILVELAERLTEAMKDQKELDEPVNRLASRKD